MSNSNNRQTNPLLLNPNQRSNHRNWVCISLIELIRYMHLMHFTIIEDTIFKKYPSFYVPQKNPSPKSHSQTKEPSTQIQQPHRNINLHPRVQMS